MPIVFDQEIHVHYGQFYVQDQTPFETEMNESFGGQANGLCGAAVPGLLFLVTGLHTGQTRVTIEVLDAPAPIGDEWEDFRTRSPGLVPADNALALDGC